MNQHELLRLEQSFVARYADLSQANLSKANLTLNLRADDDRNTHFPENFDPASVEMKQRSEVGGRGLSLNTVKCLYDISSGCRPTNDSTLGANHF